MLLYLVFLHKILSDHLGDSIAHGLISKGVVFIDLYTI